ncbi:hypothetical protein [Sphingomonas hankyongi]|uniref:Uncharacterized protein n=1 Tax=Sphingomonas hankyongi TaxID=2908209 RepID=A0ABT0S0B1_9SPHN|nr:hypothetical protein [Sphingomonas hankyongi]MCL6729280.1 hypothetical protein [Sphingomonas hankyongi]
MILFKRVGGAFKGIESREWALLSLETLGVVAGILIAFELNEWASRRNEAARHRQMMERLFEESEQDVASLREIRDVMIGFGKIEVEFATRLGRGECPPAEMWGAVYTTQMLPSFDVPRSVYQEMMGSGGLASIPDRRVREAIASFNSQLAWVEGQNDYFRSLAKEPVAPGDTRLRVRFDPAAAQSEAIDYDRGALCADREFGNRMADATRNHAVVVNYHDGITAWAIDMCGVLGASIGRNCEPSSAGPLVGEDLTILRKAVAKMR